MYISYLTAFIQGLPVGFFMSLALGPVIFAIINKSIADGTRSGLWIATGVILADLILIGIALTGVQVLLPENIQVEGPVRIAGGCILVLFGIGALRSKPASQSAHESRSDLGNILSYLSKGFALNLLNPANFILWLGANSFAKTGLKLGLSETIWFFSGALSAIFLTEVGVAFSASKVKRFLHPGVIKGIHYLTGSIFICSGIYLLIKPWIDQISQGH